MVGQAGSQVPGCCVHQVMGLVKSAGIPLSVCGRTEGMPVVASQGACVAPGSTMLVCELMEGGSVHDLVRRGALTWAEGGLDIAKDVARGLSYLHNNRIAHLDIKSGNVLLTRCAPGPKKPKHPRNPRNTRNSACTCKLVAE